MDPRKKLIPQSIDYYDNLIKGGYYYVDKTLLAKDVLDNGSQVPLKLAIDCSSSVVTEAVRLPMRVIAGQKPENVLQQFESVVKDGVFGRGGAKAGSTVYQVSP